MTNPSSVRLPVLVNLQTSERFTIENQSITLGRDPDCQLVLPEDGFASANHCRIFWDQGRLWLEDLMSSNGTSLNEQLITRPSQLSPGDVIKVGHTRFRIE
ncbi:MAG TPA: FHA domain-containing protein [Candidatus Obscuribacter sp.]|nr:FHA domain-containing protein [Candidatus Melainabacteria bacterium]MBK8223547.1 FHA domain-containing protein [Candidatus Obscuribacter sp.]MBK9276645.1 FHA domain-containing protein [Candidatus Obscuribacter sp.]MBL8082742.1 FHA domain-containing protein [Candidatus Obscuribacter sp.]MDX1987284.1 FHA domain-containing protein [Candidatus Obscuribacter sp.]